MIVDFIVIFFNASPSLVAFLRTTLLRMTGKRKTGVFLLSTRGRIRKKAREAKKLRFCEQVSDWDLLRYRAVYGALTSQNLFSRGKSKCTFPNRPMHKRTKPSAKKKKKFLKLCGVLSVSFLACINIRTRQGPGVPAFKLALGLKNAVPAIPYYVRFSGKSSLRSFSYALKDGLESDYQR